MKRRDFFKLGIQKTAKLAYQVASEKAVQRAEKWFRPPFAVDEMAFLVDCTHCSKCIKACEYDVLFKLPARYGAAATHTPVMDLLIRGCHMCEGWPCVTACEPGVLKLPVLETEQDDDARDAADPPPPKLALASIDEASCLPYSGPECGACASSCPLPGALEWSGGTKPVINQDICTGCALCREACIVSPKAITVAPLVFEEDPKEAT